MRTIANTLVCGLLLLFGGAQLAHAQETGTIRGTVTDAENGEALPGANVVVTDLQTGTAVTSDGQYELEGIPVGQHQLRVTFVGYQRAQRTVTVEAGETTQANFQLDPDYANLEEVVVTGYSQQEQQKLSTSISRVSEADIQSTLSTSPEEALQGKIAGATVSSTSGAPGGGFQVRIRGATSVNASNQPLYVVDGVPVATGQFTDGFTGGQTVNNALANIDLSNIESIEVLKDAAATAIYGTRASNGVVLIQTKRGSAGRQQVNFSYSVGSSSYTRDPGQLTGAEFARLNREAFRNDCNQVIAPVFGISSCADGFGPFSEADLRDISESALAMPGFVFNNLPNPADSSIATFDHPNAVQRIGVQHDANLTLSGGEAGSESTFRYLVSGNYRFEEGFLINQGFERLGGRMNLDYSWADNRANLSVNASYNQAQTDVIENDNNIDGALTNALLAPTYEPLRDADDPGGFNSEASAFDNPLAITRIKRQLVNTKFLGNVELSYDFLDNLTGRVSAGLDRFDQAEETFSPSFTRAGSPRGAGQDDVFTFASWIMDATLNYTTTVNDVHDFVVVGGASAEKTFRERTEVITSNFPTNQIRVMSAASVIDGGSGSEESVTGIQSGFGSVDYSYDNRYLLKLTARADGSSRFGEDNRWGFFPAASAGWNIHRESFLDDVSFLNQLKLRASYGVTGQQSFGIDAASQFEFPALGTYDPVDYNGDAALTPDGLPNPNLKWETTSQANIGLDVSVFRGRVSASVDVYQKNTDDLLLDRPLPNSSGFGTYFQNVGSIRNRGIEVQLNTVNIRTENFEWSTTINASSNSNKVTALAEGVEVIPEGFASIIKEGEPLGAFRGYVVDGIFQNRGQICTDETGESCGEFAFQSPGTQPGDFIFEDLNGDGLINSDDRKVIGNPFPDLFGGVTNTFTYRGFRLNTFVQYSYGNDVFNATDQFFAVPGFPFSTKDEVLDRWTPNNRDASKPRATLIDPNNNARNSTHFLEDGSYVRLKSVSLSYNLPETLLNRSGLRSARVFVSGKNLLTFTDFTGLDPEINSFGQDNVVQGTTFFAQPIPRFIQAGIEIGL